MRLVGFTGCDDENKLRVMFRGSDHTHYCLILLYLSYVVSCFIFIILLLLLFLLVHSVSCGLFFLCRGCFIVVVLFFID